MSKKKNKKKTVFNKVDEAMNALESIGKKEPKEKQVIEGGLEAAADKATVTRTEINEPGVCDTTSKSDNKRGETFKDEMLDLVSNSDIELNRIKSQLLEVKEAGIDLANEIGNDKHMTKPSKKFAKQYSARKSFLDSMSIGDAMQIGIMADVLPKEIEKLQSIVDDPDVDRATRSKTSEKLRKLRDEYELVKAKEELMIEEHKLKDLQRVHEKEIERRENAKARLDKLRIEYGDDLIRSLIA